VNKKRHALVRHRPFASPLYIPLVKRIIAITMLLIRYNDSTAEEQESGSLIGHQLEMQHLVTAETVRPMPRSFL
jgi:hypothetical protein